MIRVKNICLMGVAMTVILGGAMSGCGVSDVGGPAILTLSGGVRTETVTAAQTVPAGTTFVQSLVTSTGSLANVSIGGGAGLSSGQVVATIPDGTSLIGNITIPGGRIPGDIYINGTLIRAYVNAAGRLVGNIVLPAGNYEFRLEGPFEVRSAARVLNAQQIVYRAVVNSAGQAALPERISGSVPGNGGNSAGFVVRVQYPAPFLNLNTGLRVFHDNGNLKQQRTLSNGEAVYADLVTGGNSSIPSTGVNTIEFSAQYLPSPF